MSESPKEREWDMVFFLLVSVPIMILGGIYLVVTDSLIGYYVMLVGIATGFLAIIGNAVLEKLKHKSS
jgi:hypothetical protein